MSGRIERPTTAERVGALAGIVSPAVALGAILTATLLAPEFSWTADALSDLGRPGQPSTAVFNGGLILGGVLALPFCLPLARASANAAHWLATATVAVSAVSLALIGVFALPAPEHGPVAITFFLAFTVALLARGIGDVLAGARERGLTTIGFGIAHVAAWLVWAFTDATAGLAVPEFVGSALFSVWLAVTGVRLARG